MREGRVFKLKNTAAGAIIVLGFLPLFMAAETHAQDTAASGTDSDLVELWRLRRQHVGAGDTQQASEVENDLRERRRQNGVERAEDLAGAFVVEGYEHLKLRSFVQSRTAFNLAREFDPDMARAHLGLAQVAWESGEGTLAAAAALAHAARAASRHWLNRRHLLLVGTWALITGLPAAGALLFLILFLRVHGLIHHQLAARLGRRLPETTAITVAALLPWLTLGLPWGAAWTPLLWLVLASPFLAPRERHVGLVVLGILAACGLLVGPVLARTTMTGTPALLHAAGAARGSVGPDRERTLAELVQAQPDDAVLQFLYADQARGMGRYRHALRAYRRAAELDPGLRQAHNNHGSLLFSLGHYASAAQEFHRAMEADPASMLAPYNLYLTQQHRFDFSSAEATLAEAQKTDLAGITALLSERDGRQDRLDVIEDRLPVAVALTHVSQAAVAGHVGVRSLMAGVPLTALAFLGAVLLWRRRGRAGQPVQCPTCGRITCRHCTLSSEKYGHCASCAALAGRTSSLPREVRQRKKAEIAHYRARWVRTCHLLAFLLPGAGQIWGGRVIVGALLLAGASCAVLGLLMAAWLPGVPYAPLASAWTISGAAALLLLFLCWLASWMLPLTPVQTAPAAPGRG